MASKSILRRSAVTAASLFLTGLFALTFVLSGAESPTSASHAGGADAMNLDMDPEAAPANTATSLGSLEDCVRINENNLQDADEDSTDAVNIDTTVTNIPVSNPMIGFGYSLIHEEDALTVQSVNNSFLLAATPGSSLFSTADATPDGPPNVLGDDLWIGGSIDTGVAAPESGTGVLARQSVSSDAGASAGVYPLTLTGVVTIDPANDAYPPDNLNVDTDGDTIIDGIEGAAVAVDTGCPLPDADVELVALTLTSLAPPTVPAGSPFQLRTTATATNNGPNPADIEIDTSITGVPPDCNVVPPTPQITAFPAVPALGSETVMHDWTVTCTDPSTHNFSASGSVTVTGLGQDNNLANNGPLTDSEPQVITGDADVKVVGVTTTSPATAATGAPFDVTVEATLHNNGGIDPVVVDTTLDHAVPVDCNRAPNNPLVVASTSLPVSVPTNVQASWTVTCTTTGIKTFDGTADTVINQLHTVDPTPENNSGNDESQTDTSLAQADVKVTTVTVDTPPTAPISTNFPVTVNSTAHNNGPFAPANADITLTLNLPADCFTPVTTLVFEDASLGPSIAAQLPEVTFFVGCTDHSFHAITATATIALDDPLAGDPTPGNNVLTSATSTIAILRTADLKAVSATTTSPATADTGVPFNVDVDADLHNNGPDSAPADVSISLNLPPDCTTPTNPVTLSLTLPVSVLTPIPTQTFPVTCTLKSDHAFDATVSVTAPLHVIDGTPGNDVVVSNSSNTAVFAPADLKVTGVTTTSPANVVAGAAFPVSAAADLHNNGSFGPVNADATLTLSLPPDCSTPDSNPVAVGDVSLAVSATTPAGAAWSVTCTSQSNHAFTTSASVVVDEIHVTDGNAGNDSATSAASNTVVVVQADGKIASTVVLSPPVFISSNTNVPITVRKMLHNNGPFGPASFNLTKSNPPVPGCTITPPAATVHPLAVSVATQVDEIWTINCAPGSYNITFNNLLSVTGLHVTDPNASNNNSSVMITVFVDTDGDGIPDDVEVGCGSNPNNGLSIPERIDGVYAGADDDLDTSIDEALPGGATSFDCDRDGYRGSVENHVMVPNTLGDQDPCGTNTGPNTPPAPIGWPADLAGGFFSANKANVQDLASYVAPIRYLNTNVGSNPGDIRWDVLPGTGGPLPTTLNVQDMINILILKPPMLGGVDAFNGPDCPFPP